jgi:hypothetical protein
MEQRHSRESLATRCLEPITDAPFWHWQTPASDQDKVSSNRHADVVLCPHVMEDRPRFLAASRSKSPFTSRLRPGEALSWASKRATAKNLPGAAICALADTPRGLCPSGRHAGPERVTSRVKDRCPMPGHLTRSPMSPTSGSLDARLSPPSETTSDPVVDLPLEEVQAGADFRFQGRVMPSGV